MSDKKSTRKTTVKDLEKRIDLIQRQVVNLVEWSNKIADMIHYNGILPEPKNRFIPAVALPGWEGKEPKEQYTIQRRPENYTTANTFNIEPTREKKAL